MITVGATAVATAQAPAAPPATAPPPAAQAPTAQAPPAPAPAAPAAAPKEEKPHWQGQIMGAPLLLLEYGPTDQTTFALNGSIELIKPQLTYSVDGDYTFGKVKGDGFDETVADEQRLSETVRRNLTKRTYVAVRPAFKRNKVQSIDYQFEELVGYGIILAEGPRGSLHLMPIGGAVQQKKNVPGFDGGTATAGVLQISAYKFNDVWRWQETFLFMQNFKHHDDYRSQFDAALRGKIYGPFALQIKFSNERDNVVADTENKAVRQLVLGVGLTIK